MADPTVDRAEIRVIARFADPIGGRDRHELALSAERRVTVTGRSDLDGAGPTDTVLYTVPRPTAPTARLRVMTPDGADVRSGSTGRA